MINYISNRTCIFHALFLFFCILLGAVPCFSATYYVDGAASNDRGDGSESNPKKHIQSGIGLLSGGDTLIVRDGIYTGKRNRIRSVPSGTPGNETTIKAQNDFGVILNRIPTGGSAKNEEAVIALYQKEYIAVEGFVIKDCVGSSKYAISGVTLYESNHCRIRKIGIKNGVHFAARYGGSIELDHCSYCLVEDVFACGMMRYGILIFGGKRSHHNIVRRGVVRWDFCTKFQPRASIVVYGGYPLPKGEGPDNDNLIQNCIAIDGNNGRGSTFTGGFSAPAATSFLRRYGCISLNNEGFGFHSSELIASHDNTNIHCIAWDSTSKYAMWWNKLSSGTSGAYNCTIKGGQIRGPSSGSGFTCEAKNCILVDAPISDISEGRGRNANITKHFKSFRYIVRSPETNKGAVIIKKMGMSGTLFGEKGFDLLQDGTHGQANENLWPWPYEKEIIKLFRETNDPPTGYGISPAFNNTKRGFCADGQTLTNYVWGYLGNTVPPFNIQALPANNTITLTWDSPAPMALSTIAGYNIYELSNGNPVPAGSVDGNKTFKKTINKLKNHRTYKFVVKTIDGKTGESDYSYIVSATPAKE